MVDKYRNLPVKLLVSVVITWFYCFYKARGHWRGWGFRVSAVSGCKYVLKAVYTVMKLAPFPIKRWKHQERGQTSFISVREKKRWQRGGFWIGQWDNVFFLRLLFPKAGMLFTGVGQRLRNADCVLRKWLLSPEGTSAAWMQTQRGEVDRD